MSPPGSLFHPETDRPAGNDEGRGRPGPLGNRSRSPADFGEESPERSCAGLVPPPERAAGLLSCSGWP